VQRCSSLLSVGIGLVTELANEMVVQPKPRGRDEPVQEQRGREPEQELESQGDRLPLGTHVDAEGR
jgi:hypothetical protein